MSTDAEIFPIDLDKVDYDDVLSLYRGWRKSENALEVKNREYNLLFLKTEQLQDSHNRFREQILSLESVRDLAIKLQTRMYEVQQENELLSVENKKLSCAVAKIEADSSRLRHTATESIAANAAAQLTMRALQSKYEESIVKQRALEMKLSSEILSRTSAESLLLSNDGAVESLRVENNLLSDKLETITSRMMQCDKELLHASQYVSCLTDEVTEAKEGRERMITAEKEVGVLKGDVSRLIRLLDNFPSSKEFLNRWYASDGLSFLGMGVSQSAAEQAFESSSATHCPDYQAGADAGGDFDEFQFNEGALDGVGDITPGEYSQLKRLHGGDPFSMTASFEEEVALWVPRRIHHVGLRFLTEKIPHAPPRMITEFLRKLNKLWLRREQRLCTDIKTVYESQITDLKRQISNLKPYRVVIADKDVQRLKGMVKEERGKLLKGRARKPLEQMNLGQFEESDDVDGERDEEGLGGITCSGRLYKGVSRKRGGGSIVTLSKEKLLQSSLTSLESLGRQRRCGVPLGSGGHDAELLPSDGPLNPSDAYLRGALWLGRNLVTVSEEVSDSLEHFRSKFMAEVVAAGADPDLKRSRHRLNLLSVSGINESLRVMNTGRVRAQNHLQCVARLTAGDAVTFNELLRTLPVESSLPPRADSFQRRGRRASSAGAVRSSGRPSPMMPLRSSYDFTPISRDRKGS